MSSMSALQVRINKYQSILNQYTQKSEDRVEPLLQFVILLCSNKNYKGADEILLHLIESRSFVHYEKLSSIWILRSEIAEEMGELQKAVKLFEEAAKYQPQPFIDIMNAFKSFKQRHSKNNTKMNHIATPIPVSSNMSNISNKNKKIKVKLNRNRYKTQNNHLHIGYIPSPMPSIPISPIVSNQIPCTPLTDDFESIMLESEKKTKQRNKKFHFRSRQNKQNINSTIVTMPTSSTMPPFKVTLSPILDVPETDISMSSSFINDAPITPHPITPNMKNQDEDINNSMNMSGISDISSIIDGDTNNNNKYNGSFLLSPDKNRKSPELPPTTPISTISALHTKPQRFSPISALKANPPKRYKPDIDRNDVIQITDCLDNIDINNKENEFTFQSLLKQTKEMKQQQINRENKGGSVVRMELISLSPGKKNKYGSNKVLSPVRRSKRIQHLNEERERRGGDQQNSFHKLLQESNYTFVPNPMLNKTKK